MRSLICTAILLAGVSVCACANSDPENPAAAGARTAGKLPRPSAAVPTLQLSPVITGLARPVGLENAGDGSGRLFVVEQDGLIRVLAAGKLQAEPFLDIARVRECDLGGTLGHRALGFTPSAKGNERGLLGLAFHPAFRSNRQLFVNYTDGEGDTVIAGFLARADGRAVDPASCKVLLRVDQPFSNHNGGDLEFGPDGFLYIGLGDGGSANDPCNFASTWSADALKNSGQCAARAGFAASGGNPGSRALLGKMLRLDVDRHSAPGAHGLCAARADGSAAYAVPRDNAFAKTSRKACGEIWTAGWRNPWRYSFDRKTGDLYVGDVGQNAVEEINRIGKGTPAGGHYGWRGCEGDRDVNGGHCAGTLPPWLVYRHEQGRCSVTGGVLYRGPEAALQGLYLYGDYCTGEIFIAGPAATRAVAATLAPAQSLAFGITAFGEDEAGRVYVVHHGMSGESGGAVFEIRAAR